MSSLPSKIRSWLGEPLLHFTLIALLLIGAQRLYSSLTRPEIAISPELLNTLSRDLELKLGRAPTPEEKTTLAHAWLEDEILCREALKAGGTDNPRVRHLLALTLREELEPVLPDPTDEELQAYRDAEPEAFRYPAGVSFEHVSYAQAQDAPPDLMERLRRGEIPPPPTPRLLANPMPMTWLPQIEKLFGLPFAKELMQARLGEWAGPFTSSRGVHWVKVLQRDEARDMTLAEVRPALVAKCLEAKRKAAVSAKVAEMRQQYRVTLPEGIPAP